MAKTAVINPRRRKAAKKRRKARKSNPSPRAYGSARRRRTSKRRRSARRRNPSVQSAYSSGGYRQKNPDLFDFDHILSVMPAATGGIWSVRWAMNLAGPFEPTAVTNKSGQTATIAVPGIKHAIAGVIAARMGSGLIGQLLGDASKAQYAEIAALGFVGDLFMRTRVLGDSEWVHQNLMLQGVDDCDAYEDDEDDYDSGMGADGQFAIGPDGNVYQLGNIPGDPAYGQTMNGLQPSSALGGLQPSSALGRVRPSAVSGFGYA